MAKQLKLLIIIRFLLSINFSRGIDLHKPEIPVRCSIRDGSCPAEWPCCSPYGVCGSGPTCVGGCNPQYSFREDSCVPSPVLIPYNAIEFSTEGTKLIRIASGNLQKGDAFLKKGARMKEREMELKRNKMIHFSDFLITEDATEANKMLMDYDFIYSGMTQMDPTTSEIQLTMPKRSTGSLVASVRSFLYGKVSVTMKTARSGGVITALVLMSAVGDELDFEFVGSELNQVQTNHYYQGELDFTKMKKHEIKDNTWLNYHNFEIFWTEDKVDWVIDGVVVRTLYKKDTWDPNAKVYKFPDSPMRLEIAIWPGGSEKNEIGTIMWAGGLVDWDNAPDMLEKGYFSANVKGIRIEPSANRHLPRIYHCLTRKSHKDINDLTSRDLSMATFYYNSSRDNRYNENSLEWDCFNDIYLSNSSSSGTDLYYGNKGKQTNSLEKSPNSEYSNENDSEEINVEEWYRRSMMFRPKRQKSSAAHKTKSSTLPLIIFLIISLFIN